MEKIKKASIVEKDLSVVGFLAMLLGKKGYVVEYSDSCDGLNLDSVILINTVFKERICALNNRGTCLIAYSVNYITRPYPEKKEIGYPFESRKLAKFIEMALEAIYLSDLRDRVTKKAGSSMDYFSLTNEHLFDLQERYGKSACFRTLSFQIATNSSPDFDSIEDVDFPERDSLKGYFDSLLS